MKAKRHVIMFQDCFAPLVRSGKKPTTIRKTRKREIQVGDLVSLRRWTGKPYRSKQEELRCATITKVQTIKITKARKDGYFFVEVANELIYIEQVRALAQIDGFADEKELYEWFDATHGLPFEGTRYTWA